MTRVLLLFILAAALLTGCRQDDPTAATVAADTPPAPSEGTPEPGAAVAEVTVEPTETVEPTPTITPTPLPPKDLVVCLGGEPASLYLYGDNSIEPAAVRHALYESPFTSLSYSYQPLALEKLPSLADGDARVEAVDVNVGDFVVDAAGELTTLVQGIEVIDAAGQPVVYESGTIQMNQLSADFTFRPLVWSDGTPVTAEDSVFSFRVAGARGTPRVDTKFPLTANYEATGERTVRWTGRPGYLDPAYMTNVWTPLPSHQLADFAPAELPGREEAARAPLSYGAFVVDEWTPGESIRLTPNLHYYRADEGLPRLNSLTFRFLSGGETSLPTGYEECHVLTSDLLWFDALPAVEEAATAGELVEHITTAGIVEQIIFGVDLAATDQSWFQDARVRRAVTLCTDRQTLVADLTYGRGAVLDTFVSGDHSLHPDDAAQWAYDPAAANALLDEAGYLDSDGDGIRNDVTASAPFTVTLGTTDNPVRLQIAERVSADLAACGIEATPVTQDAGAWFAPGPQGVVFGRKFDLASFAWLSRIAPDCDLYMTENIPGPVDGGFNGWEGFNVSGWSNEAYDAACGAALALLPGQSGYAEAHQEAMRIFAQELPAMPLFARLRLAATTPNVLNFQLDPTQPSELWNPHELDLDTTDS